MRSVPLLLSSKYGIYRTWVLLHKVCLGWVSDPVLVLRLNFCSAEKHKIQYEQSVESVIRYKFAFEWVESEGEPWWLSEPKDPVDWQKSLSHSTKGLNFTCVRDVVDSFCSIRIDLP